ADELLAVVGDGAGPQLVLRLADQLVVGEDGAVADVEPHAPPPTAEGRVGVNGVNSWEFLKYSVATDSATQRMSLSTSARWARRSPWSSSARSANSSPARMRPSSRWGRVTRPNCAPRMSSSASAWRRQKKTLRGNVDDRRRNSTTSAGF